MPITGDFAKLEKALMELGALGRPAIVQVAAANIGQAFVTEVQLGFRKAVDPYGNPWAPLAKKRKRQGKKKRGDKILRDTGRLANSINVSSDGNSAKVGTNVEYAAYHQYGTGGHKASTRVQAVDKSGRFKEKDAFGKRKTGIVGIKLLEFKEGGGKIPARPFLPMDSLPASYAAEATRIVKLVVKNASPMLVGAAE